MIKKQDNQKLKTNSQNWDIKISTSFLHNMKSVHIFI